MSNLRRGFFSENIQNNDLTKNLDLSIQVSRDGFSFAAFSPHSRKVEFSGFGESTEKTDENSIKKAFEDFLSRNSWIGNDFRSRSLIFETHYATLLPSALFHPDIAKQIFTFNFGNLPDLDILNDEISMNSTHIIYAIPSHLNELVATTGYFNHVFSHFTILLGKQLLNARQYNDGIHAFMYIRSSAIDLMMFNGANLVFQNSFNYLKAVDILYFLNYSLEQMGFGQKAVNLELSGSISEDDALFVLLKKYIKHVHFTDTIDEIPAGISSLEYRKYYPLINSSLCVSLAEITGEGI